jgi:hypothetical protein
MEHRAETPIVKTMARMKTVIITLVPPGIDHAQNRSFEGRHFMQ